MKFWRAQVFAVLSQVFQLAPQKVFPKRIVQRNGAFWLTEVLAICNEIQVSFLSYFCQFGKYTQSLFYHYRKSRVSCACFLWFRTSQPCKLLSWTWIPSEFVLPVEVIRGWLRTSFEFGICHLTGHQAAIWQGKQMSAFFSHSSLLFPRSFYLTARGSLLQMGKLFLCECVPIYEIRS